MGDLQLVKKFKVNDGFFGRYEKLVKDVPESVTVSSMVWYFRTVMWQSG